MRRLLSAVCGAAMLFVPAFVTAQPARDAKLLLTVVDQTGAIIPNAVVTAVRIDDPAKTVLGPVKTTDKGMATLTDLQPGVYLIEVEFPGFEKRTLKDVRLRSGENKQVAILTIQGLQDSVTVARDKQVAAADPKTTFETKLTREQIEALSDDPDDMRRQIMEMGGPDAVLRIDSFVGGQLPPKSQIKSIHIARDQFAAESHFAGAHFIDIITQPGMGPIRGGTNFRLRDSALNARNPMTPTKGAEQTRRLRLQPRWIAAQGAHVVQPLGQRHRLVRHPQPLRIDGQTASPGPRTSTCSGSATTSSPTAVSITR